MRTLRTIIAVLLLNQHALIWAGVDDEIAAIDAIAAIQRGDYATAVRELHLLAENGNPWAQSYLGWMYANGKGVPQDYEEAAKWIRKAADQGDSSAQTFLGLMYDEGHGVPQDYKEAKKWFSKAADQGDSGGQIFLGFLYAEGHGVPQDYVQAHKWFNIASANGNKDAIKNRDTVAQQMTSAQIAEAHKLATEWMNQHP
jgi:hypothetical protein